MAELEALLSKRRSKVDEKLQGDAQCKGKFMVYFSRYGLLCST